MFGTNYSDTYKLLSDLYEHKFFSLPEVQGIDMKEIGKMQAKDQANKNFIKTGIGAGPEDFDFLVNPYRPMAADELARHELNHYTDFIISRNKDFIINYLIDCLVENQPFDCSSLGPNKYLNE